jgi:predicted nucleotidyltransferase
MHDLADLHGKNREAILFECVAGSRAYGTATDASDEDVRGIFAVPAADYLELNRPPDQLSDDRGNTVYFSLRRVIELLVQANPNILELLFMPEDCVRSQSPEMDLLVRHRGLFISRQCADTHAGYAMSQIKRAKGHNKWINNPKPETPPEKEDFCYVIPWQFDARKQPARPIPLRDIGWSLADYHAARLEHDHEAYRLYHYGVGARGVFRGDNLVCESIPIEDEASRFAGLLLYNERAWRQALSDHQNYWTWRRNRNEARWQQQERGELDFDPKNMMHTVRLLLSGRSLMQTGLPIVRFSGDQLTLLMDIRSGKIPFDEILSMAEDILADCERLKISADLPDVCDSVRAGSLLRELTQHWEDRSR